MGGCLGKWGNGSGWFLQFYWSVWGSYEQRGVKMWLKYALSYDVGCSGSVVEVVTMIRESDYKSVGCVGRWCGKNVWGSMRDDWWEVWWIAKSSYVLRAWANIIQCFIRGCEKRGIKKKHPSREVVDWLTTFLLEKKHYRDKAIGFSIQNEFCPKNWKY